MWLGPPFCWRRQSPSYAGWWQPVRYRRRPRSGPLVELHVGELNYCLVTIPPLVWNGFKGEGAGTALVANCSTIPHRPDEILRADPFDHVSGYDWALRHG